MTNGTTSIKPVARDIVLSNEKTYRASVSLYNGRFYISIREMYIDRDSGELRYGKNGINVLLEDGLDVIAALLRIHNDALGTTLIIADDPDGVANEG